MPTKNSSFVFRFFSSLVLLTLLFSTVGIAPVSAGGGGHIYAKPTASGTGNCLTWENACTLQTALATATSTQIWVMTGGHKPTAGTDRFATFQLKNGVSVYGGFAGTETERDQRDPLAHVTILHGNIGASDSNSDNSYHVVTGATGATLDGFTIMAGNADGAFPDYRGGGMYNPDGSSPTLANLIFLENSANFGGGLYNSSGSPALTNITFIRNSATVYGGGLYNYESNPTLTNVTFSDNTATDSGGGMLNRENSNPTLTNVTFSDNTTTGDGGGMSNFSTSSPIIRNTIFWGNTAPVGSQISNSGGSLASVSDSVVQGGYADGVNIIISDPKLGTLADHGGFTLTIPLLPGSSAIDALSIGTNGCGTTLTTDQRGVTRPKRTRCDIGAYEYDYAGTYYVKPAPSGEGNCQSWANACTLHNALLTTVGGDEIWVAAGIHKPTTFVSRGFTFQLVTGVAVYGGFTGTETARSERNPVANITILSGDINPISEGSYHVVTGATGATLDGFTITGGNANGTAPNNRGGGMYNYESSPTLRNLIFNDNSAVAEGGGLYNNDGNPTLTNVTFSGNQASTEGGGMYNASGSSPTLTNVTFNANSAQAGGGMANGHSNPTLTNVTFNGNTANGGGGMGNWDSSPTLTNVTFNANSASTGGGGMSNGGGSSPNIRNTIFWGNTSPIGAQIDNSSSTPIVSDSVIQGGYAGGTNIITADPYLGTLGDYGGLTQTIPIQAGSSAIDTGDDAVCPNADQRGVTRPQGAGCDIGAYEYEGVPLPDPWIGGVSIASDQSIVAVARPHLGSEVASYIGSAAGATTQYVPMLFKGAFGGTYNAALYIQNVSASAATLSLEFTNDSGTVVYTKADTLDPHASKGYWLPTETGLPAGFAGGVKVTSTQPILAVGRPHIGAQVMTYNGMSAGATSAWLPMFFKDGFGSYNSALYIQNVTGSSANLSIEYINLDGTVACTDNDTLGANASKGYWSLAVACDTGSLPSGFVGGVKVTSTQNILAVGRAHLGTQITTYNGSAAGATSAYVPMLFKNAFSGGSYDAALYLQNVSASSATVQIEYLNSAGTVAATQNVTLAANAISSIWLPSLVSLPDGFAGGARITSTQDVIAVGRPHLGSEISAYNGAPAGSLNAHLPMLFKNAYGGGYDAAFYVQNTSGSAANVEISFYDSAGVLSCVKFIDLAAGATQGFWMPTVTCAP